LYLFVSCCVCIFDLMCIYWLVIGLVIFMLFIVLLFCRMVLVTFIGMGVFRNIFLVCFWFFWAWVYFVWGSGEVFVKFSLTP
jgi:hypothetical protein